MTDTRLESNSVTTSLCVVPFRDGHVSLIIETDDERNCPHTSVAVMHHTGNDGKHYCPTGFVMCYDCWAVGDEPDPPECTLWGMLP